LRSFVAAALAPVSMAGTSIVATIAVTTAAAAGVSVVSAAVAAAPAKAATESGNVLVVLVNGETSAPEAALLTSLGYTVTTDTPAQLAAMSKATFDGYSTVVIGDSSSNGTCSTTQPSTSSLGTNWEPWVTGNVAVLGTAPELAAELAGAGQKGAANLITGAVEYTAAGYTAPSSTGTGLYLSLNCGYATSPKGTAVSLLADVEGIGAAGGVTVQGGIACTDSGTVNSWEAVAAGTFSGYTSTSLTAGASVSWPSPGCPVQEAFDSWPAMFTPMAYDSASNSDVTANFTASDGATGQPYVLFGQAASAATAALAPSTGGEVPPGTTAGGTANPAAKGVSQPLAGQVNTESGDLTESATDVSVPTFGPSLTFSRTYDAETAQQEIQAGGATPGPLGYMGNGWSYNWESSLTASEPVSGDIYTADGLGTDTGIDGAATQAAIGHPEKVALSAGNTYIADAGENRILEVAGANQTQWGITMTAGDVYTIVGSPTGASGDSPNGTPASTSLLNDPSAVAADNSGDLFIADTGNNRVLELAASTSPWGAGSSATEIPSSATADDLYVVAGTGTEATGSDGGAAYKSALWQPASVLIGGNAGTSLYIADTGNDRIQEVPGGSGTQWGKSMSAYDVYTVAGSPSGTLGSSGDGGAATSALLDGPQDVAISPSGDLYIADTWNCRIQEVPKASGTQWGNSTSFTANDIYTVAGQTGTCAAGIDGQKATSSALSDPSGIGYAAGAGGLYVADTDNHRIQEVAASTGTQYGQSMTIGDVYTIAGTGISGNDGDGTPATQADISHPTGVVNSGTSLIIAAYGDDEVREVSATSPYDISDLAGNDTTLATAGNYGPATAAALRAPEGETTDALGDIYIADSANNRVQEIASYPHTQFGINMTAGEVYTIAGEQDGTGGDWGNGEPATWAALNDPSSVAVDSAGNLYIADTGNSQVREVSASSDDVSTIAGTGTAGITGNSGPAAQAELECPAGLALDKSGDIYISDSCANQVREIYASGGQAWEIPAGWPGTSTWSPEAPAARRVPSATMARPRRRSCTPPLA
jgi:hypothetical protein